MRDADEFAEAVNRDLVRAKATRERDRKRLLQEWLDVYESGWCQPETSITILAESTKRALTEKKARVGGMDTGERWDKDHHVDASVTQVPTLAQACAEVLGDYSTPVLEQQDPTTGLTPLEAQRHANAALAKEIDKMQPPKRERERLILAVYSQSTGRMYLTSDAWRWSVDWKEAERFVTKQGALKKIEQYGGKFHSNSEPRDWEIWLILETSPLEWTAELGEQVV